MVWHSSHKNLLPLSWWFVVTTPGRDESSSSPASSCCRRRRSSSSSQESQKLHSSPPRDRTQKIQMLDPAAESNETSIESPNQGIVENADSTCATSNCSPPVDQVDKPKSTSNSSSLRMFLVAKFMKAYIELHRSMKFRISIISSYVWSNRKNPGLPKPSSTARRRCSPQWPATIHPSVSGVISNSPVSL